MKKNILYILIILTNALTADKVSAQISSRGFKTALDMSIDESGTTLCEVTNTYNAAYWDMWTKVVGSNVSIINNQLKKLFPKYHLSDFKHSQDVNARSNTVKFKIDGMMNINKSGKWEADLDRKDPNITKISNREWLLVEEGETMKIHLPASTKNAKVEKNSFGKAMLTYSASTGGGMMATILKFGGILIALAGVALFIRNRMKIKVKPTIKISEPKVTVQKESAPVVNVPNEISNN